MAPVYIFIIFFFFFFFLCPDNCLGCVCFRRHWFFMQGLFSLVRLSILAPGTFLCLGSCVVCVCVWRQWPLVHSCFSVCVASVAYMLQQLCCVYVFLASVMFRAQFYFVFCVLVRGANCLFRVRAIVLSKRLFGASGLPCMFGFCVVRLCIWRQWLFCVVRLCLCRCCCSSDVFVLLIIFV